MNGNALKTRPFFLLDRQIGWVSETLESLTLEQKISQILIARTVEETEHWQTGGLFINTTESQLIAETVRNLQSKTNIPLLIAADLSEGPCGLASDATDFLSLPTAKEHKDPLRVEEVYGAVCGREARSLGCNLAFIPRSDSRNPDYTFAFIRGCQSYATATAPGTVTGEDGCKPFLEAVVTAGTMAMLASQCTAKDIQEFRTESGFLGVLISDLKNSEEDAPLLLKKGIDVLISNKDTEYQIKLLKTAIDNGTLPAERLNEAAFRVIALKAALRLDMGWKVFPDLEKFKEACREDSTMAIM